MKEIYVKDILKICKGTLICGDENIICENFSKDTREIESRDVYIGIKGENFDGNNFYKEAFEKGASVCIIEKEEIEKVEGKTIIKVENTIDALQKLATYKRSLYNNIPVIAITGSVGKTSTKDMIANVVNQKYKVLKTQGNLNNHIGLPLTILKLKDHNAIVVEMGMNHFGEIRTLTNIVKPNICVITNIGTSHIGNLGSRENILKAKLEILEGMEEKGTIIINNDNDLLNKWAKENEGKYSSITFGIDEKSNIQAKNIELDEAKSNFIFEMDNKEYKVEVPVQGKHFVYNSLAAIAVGTNLNIPINEIQKGIKEFSLTKNRMEIKTNKQGIIIINDSYNASFDSMKASLEVLSNFNGNKKIAVLGDMFELGSYAENLHRKVGKEVADKNIDILITVGNLSKNIAKEAIENKMNKENIYIFDTKEEAICCIEKIAERGDVILVKASNGMKFNKIVEKLLN